MWCTDTFKFHLWNQNADHIMQVTEDHLLKILTNLYGLQSSWDRLNFRRLNCSGMFLESHIFADMSSHRFLEIICKTRTNKDDLVIPGDGIVLTNKRLIMIKHLHMLCTASKISVQWEQKLLAYNEWLYKMGQKEQYLHVHKTCSPLMGTFVTHNIKLWIIIMNTAPKCAHGSALSPFFVLTGANVANGAYTQILVNTNRYLRFIQVKEIVIWWLAFSLSSRNHRFEFKHPH